MAKKKKFSSKNTFVLPKKEAQVVGEKLHELAEQNGGELETKSVLAEAKKRTSILHKYFEWSDTKAAHEYRMHQARHLIAVVVELRWDKGVEEEQKSFFSVSKDRPSPVYITVDTVVQNKDYIDGLFEEFEQHIQYLGNTMKQLRKLMRKNKR